MALRQIRVNLLDTATLTAASEAAAYPLSNLRLIADLDLPYRTTSASGDQRIIINHGSAKAVAAWAALGCNFATARFQAHTADDWTSPAFPGAEVVVGTNYGNGRLCRFERLSAPQTYQFNSLLIPNGTPTTDGAAYYRVGALIVGALTDPPRGIAFAPEPGAEEPVRDVFTVSKRRQRSRMGPDLFRLSGRVQAVDTTTGGVLAQRTVMRTYVAWERAWKEADVALIAFDDVNDPYHACVMRSLSPMQWREEFYPERSFEWEEVA